MNRRKFWDNARVEQLREMYWADVPRKKIGEHFNVSANAIACQLTIHGIKGRHARRGRKGLGKRDHATLIPKLVAIADTVPPGFKRENVILRAVMQVYEMDIDAIHRRDQKPFYCEPRKIGMALAARFAPIPRVAKCFGRNRKAVERALERYTPLIEAAMKPAATAA